MTTHDYGRHNAVKQPEDMFSTARVSAIPIKYIKAPAARLFFGSVYCIVLKTPISYVQYTIRVSQYERFVLGFLFREGRRWGAANRIYIYSSV